MSATLHFDTPFSYEKSVHILTKVGEELKELTNGRVSRTLDPHALLRGVVDYRVDWDPFDLMIERQLLAFYQKNASVPLDTDPAAAAYQKFFEAEDSCSVVNKRFRERSKSLKNGTLDAALCFRVMRKIAFVLGECPDPMSLDFGFGPGSNVGVSRRTSARRKLSVDPTCTVGALKFVEQLQAEFPHWKALSRVQTCDYGKLTTVPKNALTDRCIVVEPLINTFMQKGVGRYIRQRLKRVGIDLRDQSRNRLLAKIGSVDGSYATIDLSSASDTIASEVVAELLPHDWWSLLYDLRTPVVKHNGLETRLQKFSSMGNGFTFELESLIFYAIASAVCDKDDTISVYGDDIIVPSDKFDEVSAALVHFGFSVNLEKSFWFGNFRESCGGDYFGGVDIRPCYVKGLLSVRELFRLHNFFYRRGLTSLLPVLLQYIPRRFRIYGPDGFGDGHLLGDHPKQSHNKKRGWGGYCFKTYTVKPRSYRDPMKGDYAAWLLQSSLTDTNLESCFARPGVVRRGDLERVINCKQTGLPSSTMYQERNLGRLSWKLTRVYTLG